MSELKIGIVNAIGWNETSEGMVVTFSLERCKVLFEALIGRMEGSDLLNDLDLDFSIKFLCDENKVQSVLAVEAVTKKEWTTIGSYGSPLVTAGDHLVREQRRHTSNLLSSS
jgi:hypothetical protein